MFFGLFVGAAVLFLGFGVPLGRLFLIGAGFGLLALCLFQFGELLVEFQGSEFVDEAEADFAGDEGVGVGLGVGPSFAGALLRRMNPTRFGDGDILKGTRGNQLLGEVEIETLARFDAIQRVEADDLGEEEALLGQGEWGFCLSWNRR